VRESLRERTVHLRIAPDLVELKSFFIPVYADTRRRPWQLKIGLALYALLGGFGRGTGFGSVAKRDWPQLDGLQTRNLDAVIRYYDAQTDDAALTRAVVDSARSLGGELPCRDLPRSEPRRRGRRVQFDQGGAVAACRARVLVNGSRPWATQVARAVTPAIQVPPWIWCRALTSSADAVKAGIYYVESPADGRAIFHSCRGRARR